MSRRHPRMADLTESEIEQHQRTIFEGIPEGAWKEMEDHASAEIGVRRMMRTLIPTITFALPHGDEAQKGPVKTLLHAMTLMLPENSFSYRFNDPMQPDVAVIAVNRSQIQYLNEIRAVHFDDVLDATLMKVRDDLKDPLFDRFIECGGSTDGERRQLSALKTEALNSINLYHADSIPMPTSEVVGRVTTMREAIAVHEGEGGSIVGPLGVVASGITQGKYPRDDGAPMLRCAQDFERHALDAEAITLTLEHLGVRQGRA